MIDQAGQKLNLPPMHFSIDRNERNIVGNFHAPTYKSDQSLLADLLNDYEHLMAPLEKPMEGLASVFQVDEHKAVVDVALNTIHESITHEEMRHFFKGELGKIQGDIINKDIE